MSGTGRRDAWVEAVGSMVGDRLTGPGRHAWDRLARLLEYAEVRWVDGEHYEDDMRLNGTLGVFTIGASRIVDCVRASLQRIVILMSQEDGHVNAKRR